MKTCPKCAFANEEHFPTCVWCNTSLAQICSLPSQDATHPEHQRNTIADQRTAIIRRQSLGAVLVYALTIAFLAAVPGMIFAPGILTLFFTTALLVGALVYLGIAGQFSSSMLQGVISIVLLIFSASYQPFVIFTLVGHIILPGFLWHAIAMIDDVNR
jgi:hypothetical protein